MESQAPCHRQGLDRRFICVLWMDRSEAEAGLGGCSCGMKPGSDGAGEHGTGASRSVNLATMRSFGERPSPKKQKGHWLADGRDDTGGEG
jgi:hypothetical protein